MMGTNRSVHEVQMDTIDPAVLARDVTLSPTRRRRSYSAQEKLRIVQETLKPGASVSVVARRHDVNANMVFTWRRHHQEGSLVSVSRKPRKPKLLPVFVQPDEAERGPCKSDLAQRDVLVASTGRIEIEFPGGVRLRTDGRVDADALRAAIRELSQP
jgi:transposase